MTLQAYVTPCSRNSTLITIELLRKAGGAGSKTGQGVCICNCMLLAIELQRMVGAEGQERAMEDGSGQVYTHLPACCHRLPTALRLHRLGASRLYASHWEPPSQLLTLALAKRPPLPLT